MGYYILDILRLHCIEYGEEVFPISSLVLRVLIWEVLHDYLVVFESRVNILNRELIKLRNINESAFINIEELLLIPKNLFEEVLISHDRRRNIQLNYTKTINHNLIYLR